MTRYIYLFSVLCISLLFTSCGSLYDYTNVRSTALTPDVVRMDINIDKLEPLGEMEVSVDYRTYLGFIRSLDSINHIAYDRREINKVHLKGPKDFAVPRYLNRATYKITEAFPNADYYVPMYTSRKLIRMFLGRQTRQSMMIKAYKLK